MIKSLYFSLAFCYLLLSVVYSNSCTSKYGKNKLEGECKPVDDCTGAALAGDCARSDDICCIEDKEAPILPENPRFTKSVYEKLVGKTKRNSAIYNYIVESMRLADIDGRFEDFKIAAYLATLVGESFYFKNLESRIIDTDGQNETWAEWYQPRGGILLRGRDNYVLANQATNYSKPISLLFYH
jgi:hypothetical protein